MKSLPTLALTLVLVATGCKSERETPPRAKPSRPPTPMEEAYRCYLPELRQNSTLEGKVTVGYDINPDGKISNAHVEDTTLNNKAVEQCLLLLVSGWSFKISSPTG